MQSCQSGFKDITDDPLRETDPIEAVSASLPSAASDQSFATFAPIQQGVAGDTRNVDLGAGGVDMDVSSAMLDDSPTTFEWDWNESLNLDPSFYLADTNFMYVDGLTLNGPPQVVSTENQPPAAATTSTPMVQTQPESPMPLSGRKSIPQLFGEQNDVYHAHITSRQRRFSRQPCQQPPPAYPERVFATHVLPQSLHTHLHHKALAPRANHSSPHIRSVPNTPAAIAVHLLSRSTG